MAWAKYQIGVLARLIRAAHVTDTTTTFVERDAYGTNRSLGAITDGTNFYPMVSLRCTGMAHDWTEGTGTLPVGGQVTITAPASTSVRKWIFIQNQSDVTIPILVEARLADGTTQSFATILLASGGSVGNQGGADERNGSNFTPNGIIKVGSGVGTASKQVCILELIS